MSALQTSILLLLLCLLSPMHGVSTESVGDEVCIVGYIMDNFCIEDTQNIYGTEEGVLLDNPNIVTLQHPEEHSFHCLLDVSSCYKSGFRVLGEKDPATDRHSLGYRLDDSEAVITVGRAMGKKGYCSTCDGGTQETGFRATVRGIIKDIGDGSDPTLTSFTMLDASVGCDGDDNPAVLSSGTDNESNDTRSPSLYPVSSKPTITPSSSSPVTSEPTSSPSSSPVTTSEPTISSPSLSPITTEPTPKLPLLLKKTQSPSSSPVTPDPAISSSGTDNESNGGSYGFENSFKCAVLLIVSILFVLGL